MCLSFSHSQEAGSETQRPHSALETVRYESDTKLKSHGVDKTKNGIIEGNVSFPNQSSGFLTSGILTPFFDISVHVSVGQTDISSPQQLVNICTAGGNSLENIWEKGKAERFQLRRESPEKGPAACRVTSGLR